MTLAKWATIGFWGVLRMAWGALCLLSLGSASLPVRAQAQVTLQTAQTRVGMGRSVLVRARVTLPNGKPAAGYRVLPYVNGVRWGAHETTDAQGEARLLLPLPRPGVAEIKAWAQAPASLSPERWIWAKQTRDNQTVAFRRIFMISAKPKSAKLWVAADDSAQVFLNGKSLGEWSGWKRILPRSDITAFLKQGENFLSVRAKNGSGPAGLLARLEWKTEKDSGLLVTDSQWRAGEEAREMEAPALLGSPSEGAWANDLGGWAGVTPRAALFAGSRLGADATNSNAVRVEVFWRRLQPPPSDPNHLVGMQYEPWFVDSFGWTTAQAVPLMGFYRSHHADILRQHMIWLIESGIDFLVTDWTNHLWDCKHWNERPEGANEIIHATTQMLETLAALRDEGERVPKVVLYLGLNNGPVTTMTAVNEELDWIYHNYLRNPRFRGLFQFYEGKPLALIHNGGGPRWLEANPQDPVDARRFTYRWQSFMNEISGNSRVGYWSWMDAKLRQSVTLYQEKPEAMTVSTAFFAPGGWKAKESYGRQGGWTYIESFRGALRARPRFLQLHQFQEFAGQIEGQGYGEKRDLYVDSYSVELSDDIEPVSLTASAYRGEGGWGFLYLNLTRALVDLYRQKTPQTTVLAIRQPLRMQKIASNALRVEWTWAGKKPSGFRIEINGKPVAQTKSGVQANLSLKAISEGKVTVKVTAEGTQGRYALSYGEDALPAPKGVPVSAEIEFWLQRTAKQNPAKTLGTKGAQAQ